MIINISVVSNNDRSEVFFAISSNLVFHKMFKMYNERYDINHKFYFNDDLLDDSSNPITMKMKNGDKIYASQNIDEIIIENDLLKIDNIDKYVTINISGIDGISKICIEKSTLLISFLQKQVEEYDYRNVYFYYGKNLIIITDTPDSLGMQDDDIIKIVIL